MTGVDVLDLGERRLRDLSGAQHIFQVRAEGLGEQFPPLRTVDTVPGNLRPQATGFVGRETEVAQLVDLVRAHHLVTLTGVGGVGKTRLALQVALIVRVRPHRPGSTGSEARRCDSYQTQP